MGTAVDANIIIYERAEELRDGKSLDAVKASYSWTGAMRSIVDANSHFNWCCIVHIWFRTNKGFATTLLIGIITSLFTSIFLQESLSKKTLLKANLTFVTNFLKTFYKLPFRFLKSKKMDVFVSAVVVVSCVIGDKQIRSRS
jgi:SecD/SecF fusion protein